MNKNYFTAETRNDVWELVNPQVVAKYVSIKKESPCVSCVGSCKHYPVIEVNLRLDIEVARDWMDNLEKDLQAFNGEKTFVLREYDEFNVCKSINYFENYRTTRFSTLTFDYTSDGDWELEITFISNDLEVIYPNWLKNKNSLEI